MKTSIFFVFFLIFAQYNISLGQTSNKESFDEFFENFGLNPKYQLSRIKFPIPCINKILGEDPDTAYIKKEEWKHQTFYWRDERGARGQIYDSFDHKLKDTDERVFEWKGFGNDGQDLFFFKRIDGKWYLVKRVSR